MLTWLVRLLAAIVVVATLLPLVRKDAWWIRVCEFPRAQLFGLSVLVLAALPFSEPVGGWLVLLMVAVLLASALQGLRILPFTPLWPRGAARRVPDGEGAFGLLVANVLMTNREAERFLSLVAELEPAVVLVIEADRWWQEALAPLKADYPHRIGHPRDDTYGMLLFSRLPIRDPEVRFLVTEDVPSLRCRLELPGGGEATIYGLHPKPPVPHEQPKTTKRDAELVLVALEAAETGGSAIVAGDLNDVAWSYTTRRFRRISALVDPRVGHGLFGTFPATRWWLRFPLDHIFHSPDLRAVEMRVERDVGSDHLPIYARLRPMAERRPRRAGAV